MNSNQVVILNEEQFADVIYKTVNRCLDEREVNAMVSKKEEEEYYDRNELCKLLHIALPTLWRIEQKGLLKCKKVGRKNLYSKQEVNQLIHSGKLAKYNRAKS